MVLAVRNPVSAVGQHINNKNPVRKEPQNVWGLWRLEVLGWEGDLQSFSELIRKIAAVTVSPTWCNHQHDIDLKWSCCLWVLIFAAWVCGRPVSPAVAPVSTLVHQDARDWSRHHLHSEQPVQTDMSWDSSLHSSPFGSYLLRELNSDSYTFHVEQCGVPLMNDGFLPSSPKTSLPLMEVGPGEEMLGHWRSGEANLGLWGPASKWITCLSLMAPRTDSCQSNSPETETSELELVGLRGAVYSSQWPKYLHLLSRPAFYFQPKEIYMPRVFKYQRRVCCQWPGQR